MAFTLITITSTEVDADDQPAAGQVTFTLTQALTNADVTVEPSPIVGIYNTEGQLTDSTGEQPLRLVATDDPGTEPAGAQYDCVIEVQGAPLRTGSFTLPSTAPAQTIDLSELMA